ncbi:MAG: prepilin-type N-terminal cleavage/methylation domain-containing protein [Xanthomonadales bacterium]|nr:prepilin-type N-terminal cleavage/methylation domain-containing protein [Xanthomonadales bacterium]
MNRQENTHLSKRLDRGFALMEVVVAIAIFAIGLLAYAQFQGNLTRSAGDAKLRTAAGNLGEELVEVQRRFRRLDTDPLGQEHAYQDINDRQFSVTRDGLAFDIVQDVTDYYWDSSSRSFSTVQPAGRLHSDFKRVTLEVAWADPVEFRVQDEVSTSGQLGGGKITLNAIVSSVVTATNHLALIDDLNGQGFDPEVPYEPGELPDVVALDLGNNVFRETSTPLPDVIRADELVETGFDLVTYNSDPNGAIYRRREDIRVVSCNCSLQAPPADVANRGHRPMTWNGAEYVVGEAVAKPVGVAASGNQSPLCDICCRDHHDGGSGAAFDATDPGRGRYDPFRSSTEYIDSGLFSGDHKHYSRDRDGELLLADSVGDAYVEACRLVRKDGFFQVAQDLRQEGLHSFPADYLDQVAEEAEYSGYVTEAVKQFVGLAGNNYEVTPPTLPEPAQMVPPLAFPASSSADASALPTALGADSQQLRSRGVYVNYLTDEARALIQCLSLEGSGCGAPGIANALEAIPFFDVQLTWLSRWNEIPVNYPVNVTNQAVASNNTHSRGLAQLASGTGLSQVRQSVHKGNLGLTGTDPIDPEFGTRLAISPLYVNALSGMPAPTPGAVVVAGEINSSVPGVRASDVETESTEAQCDRNTTGYVCLVNLLANSPTLKVSNYERRNRTIVACSGELDVEAANTGSSPYTVFYLPTGGSEAVTADIVLKQDSCG